MFSYDEWCKQQADKLRSAMNRLAMSGIYDAAVFVIPSNGSVAGELVLSTEPQALEVLHFTGHGTRVCAVPYSHLYHAIWHACRRMPIVPVQS
jgi:hypothetical protein